MSQNAPAGQPPRKLDTLLNHMRAGEWQDALSLANSFHRFPSKTTKKAVERAHGMYTNPRFYTQMGYDRDATIAAGRNALIAAYGDRL